MLCFDAPPFAARFRRAFVVGATSLLTAGCAPHVQLEVPAAILSSGWDDADPVSDATVTADDSWSAFGSDKLQDLIKRAHAANPDIGIAAARILQAQGSLIEAGAANGPTLTGSADGSSDIRNLQGQTRSFDRIGSAGVDITYDLDLFGGARAQKAAARSRLQGAEYESRAVRLATETEVTRAYVLLAALSDRQDLTDRAKKNARELERIIRIRAGEGVANQVDVGLQTTEGNAIEVSESRLVESSAKAKNALAILLGEEAPRFSIEADSLDNLTRPHFGLVQPGDLIRRRPDIMAAEAKIAAANGDVAQARAAFMPRLRFSADSFFDVTGAGTIINLGGSIGGSLLLPIFDRGRLKGRLTRVSGEQQEAAEAYRKTILTAFAQAQNALAASAESRRRLTLLSQSRGEALRTAKIAKQRYIEGVVGLSILLDADRRLLQVEDALATAKQDCLIAAIDLFSAMGGPPSPK